MFAPKAVECATVDMQADTAECDASTCRLRDHARMSCGGLLLFADAIDIHFDQQHQFAGAEATGHTLMVQEGVVATCHHAAIAADRVSGLVTGASGRNWASYGEEIALPAGFAAEDRASLTDPQTSGGLLVSCAPDAVDEVLAVFRRHGFDAAADIGVVSAAARADAPRLRISG